MFNYGTVAKYGFVRCKVYDELCSKKVCERETGIDHFVVTREHTPDAFRLAIVGEEGVLRSLLHPLTLTLQNELYVPISVPGNVSRIPHFNDFRLVVLCFPLLF